MTTATADTSTDTTATDDDTSTDTTDTTSTDTTTDTTKDTDTGPDLAKDVEKWRNQSRKHEQQAKANAAAAKELADLKQKSMSDQEKAVEAARIEARTEALTEMGGKLAKAAIRVAAADRMSKGQINALMEGIDPKAFLDDDGEPDEEAIAKWVDRVAPKTADGSPPARRDIGQGARGGQAPALNDDQLVIDLKSKLGVA